ncbi:DUF933 domain-containing protein [Streptomyces longwoodensis]|nr:DUF933 domain-containing protein [Streptomyces longwoodensis]
MEALTPHRQPEETPSEQSRAWTLMNGATAPEATGVVHTDFKKGFIKAEVAA